MTWQGQPLGMVEPEQARRPTVGAGRLVYPGALHLFTGEPESLKTIVAYATALETLRADPDAWVALVDFEMGATLARQRFTEMGATIDELDRIMHFEPDHAPTPAELAAALLDPAPAALVIYDASAGAYNVAGLDDNKRQDVERFAKTFIRPLRQARVTTIVLDHVAKAKDGRGRWPIGSECKQGGADVVLGFETIKPLSRGHDGLVRIAVHKDRFGFLTRPNAAELELHSHPDTHAITWQWKPPTAVDDNDTFRPTVLMQRVSEYLERQPEPVSLRVVEDNVRGRSRVWTRKAVEQLLAEKYIVETKGSRGARMLASTAPFRDLAPPRPTSPGEDGRDLAHLAHPLQGGEVRGEVNGANTHNDLAGEVERLAEKYSDLIDDARGPSSAASSSSTPPAAEVAS